MESLKQIVFTRERERDAARREVEELKAKLEAEKMASEKWGKMVDDATAELATLRAAANLQGRRIINAYDMGNGQTQVLLAPRDEKADVKPSSPTDGPAMATLRTAPQSGSMATEHAIQALFELAARVKALEQIASTVRIDVPRS